MAGHRLEEAIEKEFSGCIKDGLKAILQCAIDRNEFFASCLYKSMKGLGTNDNQLIRVIVSRSEIDLEDIKVAFERLYGKSLRCWIKVSFNEFSPQRIQLCDFSLGRHIWLLQTCFICSYWRRTCSIN